MELGLLLGHKPAGARGVLRMFDDVGIGHPVPRQLILQGRQIHQQIIKFVYTQGEQASVQRRLGGR